MFCLKINNQTSQLSRAHKPEGEAPMSCDDRCVQQRLLFFPGKDASMKSYGLCMTPKGLCVYNPEFENKN